MTAVKQLATDRKLQSLSLVFLNMKGETIEKHVLDILNLQGESTDRYGKEDSFFSCCFCLPLKDSENQIGLILGISNHIVFVIYKV